MRPKLPEWGPIRYVLFFAGFLTAFYVVGIAVLTVFSMNLSRSSQAMVIATVLGSFGTLLLALATFINVFQANRRLEIEEKEREKPLVRDELSYVIQPAITSLKNNLSQMEDSDNPGCAFDWIYIDSPSFYSSSRGPRPVRTPDSLPMARLAGDDKILSTALRVHDVYVTNVAEMAKALHQELVPKFEELLAGYDVQNWNQGYEVITSAVLKELDHFGEDHELYDFWEENRNHLIFYANEETTTTLNQVKSAEEDYQGFIEKAIEDLQHRKIQLQREYSISEEEISRDSEYDVLGDTSSDFP